jgi:cardiolipin synthase C
LISPYFVPGWTGAAYFRALAKRGVKITVLTNSLAATDVAAVHTGYARWRKSLLKAGIALFEMKRAVPRPAGRRRRWLRGSGSSLHAKTFVVDRAQVFIGSFNFDPRSARLNTELGFIIDSPELAAPIAQAFAVDVPQDAYRLRLNAGALQWVEQLQGREIVHTEEPTSGFWRRLAVAVLSLLPLERQL